MTRAECLLWTIGILVLVWGVPTVMQGIHAATHAEEAIR